MTPSDRQLPPRSASAEHRWRLVVALGLVGTYFVVELVGGLLTGSLALLGDAGHLLTDVAGLGMALAAVSAAMRARPHPRRSFGLHRLEILAALANAVLLAGVVIYLVAEGVRRLLAPTEVAALPVLVIAVLGLGVNLIAFRLLHPGARDSLNLEGAMLEVLADALSSVGVIVASLVVLTTGWTAADPIVAIAIALFLAPRVYRLARKAVHVLLQGTPEHLDLDTVRDALEAIESVIEVHDLHAWTLTSGMDVVTVHVVVRSGTDLHQVLDRAQSLLADDHGVEHATVQVEPEDHSTCERVAW